MAYHNKVFIVVDKNDKCMFSSRHDLFTMLKAM